MPLSLQLRLGLPLPLIVRTIHVFITIGLLLHWTAGMVVTVDIVFTAGFVQLPKLSIFIERLLEASGEHFINLQVVLNLWLDGPASATLPHNVPIIADSYLTLKLEPADNPPADLIGVQIVVAGTSSCLGLGACLDLGVVIAGTTVGHHWMVMTPC